MAPPSFTPVNSSAAKRLDRTDGSEMRGDSVENKQIELIMSDRWFR